MKFQSCRTIAASPVRQRSSAPGLDALCSQEDKRAEFGWTLSQNIWIVFRDRDCGSQAKEEDNGASVV